MKKLLSLLFLFSLMTTACMHIPTMTATEVPAPLDGESTPIKSEISDQPLFGDVIYNTIKQCQSAGLNQACHRGEMSDLSAGQSFRVESSALDSYDIWVFRLQAPGVDSDFESLLILAAGNTEVHFDEVFIGRDETNQNLPRLVFSTTDGADFSSGLVIINESEEDLLSLEVNGVGLTLGSTAVATSQPNGEMKVRMLTGTVAATTSETVHAAASETVRVRMTAESKPQPAQPVLDENGVEITPLAAPVTTNSNKDDDPMITPLTSENDADIELDMKAMEEFIASHSMRKFNRAYNRCMEGDARQVYNVMYFAHFLLDPNRIYMRRVLGDAALQTVREQVKQCATFELILTGSQQGSSALSWTSKVSGDVLKLQFDHNGKLVAPVEGELTVTEFTPDMPLPPGCTSTTETANSVLRVQEYSTLKIYYNTMRIRLYFWPNPVTEKLIMNCPSAPPVEIPLDWNTYFWYVHPDLLRKENQSYLIQNWEYTGGQIYAEAFYLNRSGTIEGGTVTSDTSFTLMHTPQE